MPAPKMPSHHTGAEQCSLLLTSGHLPSEQLAYSKPWSIIVGFLNPEVRCSQGGPVLRGLRVFLSRPHFYPKPGLHLGKSQPFRDRAPQHQLCSPPSTFTPEDVGHYSAPDPSSSHLIPRGWMGSAPIPLPGGRSPLSQGLGFQTLPVRARGVSPHADPAGHSSKPPTGKTGTAAPLSPLT